MGKGDQKSRRGKITAGSYGKRRPRKSNSVKNIAVNVLDEDDKKAAKTKVRKEVGYPAGPSENAEVKGEPKTRSAAKPKTEKAEKADTKATSKKATADSGADDSKPKASKSKKTEE